MPKGKSLMFYASATGNMTRDNVAERYDLANGVRVIRTSEIKSISIFVHTSYQEDSAWAQWKLFDGDLSRSTNFGVTGYRDRSTSITGFTGYEYLAMYNGSGHLMADISFN